MHSSCLKKIAKVYSKTPTIKSCYSNTVGSCVMESCFLSFRLAAPFKMDSSFQNTLYIKHLRVNTLYEIIVKALQKTTVFTLQ